MVRFLRSLIPLATLCLVAASVLLANWQRDDKPVCTDPAVQQWPAAAADGFGGTLLAWFDGRTSCIYAQRMSAEGEPLWGPSGVPAGIATVASQKPQIMSDGKGGAYVVFERDSLDRCWDVGTCLYIDKIFLSKLSANGALLWQRRLYIPVATGPSSTDGAPSMVPDGEGGIVVTWLATNQVECWVPCIDCGCEWIDYKVMAQRIDSTGAFRWGDSHVTLFAASEFSYPRPRVVSDGTGGYLATFEDPRPNDVIRVCAQRVSSDGRVLWAPGGATVFMGPGVESIPAIAADGRGGAIIVWPTSDTNPNYYAQRIDSSGNQLWPTAGVPVAVATGSRYDLNIVPGAPGNAIVSWRETRGGVPSIYAQRLDPMGNAVWTQDGMRLNSSGLQCLEPTAAADGSGGAVFAWVEFPSGSGDTFRAVWGDSTGPRFAVGTHGFICRYDNGAWSAMPSPTQATLLGLWGSSASDVFAVGAGGTILHYDGFSWQSMSSGTSYDLYGVWGVGPTSVYAAGNQGTIIHFNGSTWSPTGFSGPGVFYGISGSSENSVIAVGEYRLNGLVAIYNGSTWSTHIEGYYYTYNRVWVSPDNKIFIAGSYYGTGRYQGAIRYYVGGGWVDHLTGVPDVTWASVWGASGSNVYALFLSGHIMRFDGTSWGAPSQISTFPMYDIWGRSGSDVYAVGQPRAIIHLQDSTREFMTGTAGVLTAQRVDSSGTKLWRDNGAEITLSAEEEREPTVAVDAAGFATFAWKDSRNGNWDIYSRRVSIARGPLVGTLVSFYEAKPAREGIAVRWELIECDKGARFLISRSRGTGDPIWQGIERPIRREGLSFVFLDSDGVPGSTYRYRVEAQSAGDARLLFETAAAEMPAVPLTLYQNVPNPFNPSTTIRYFLPVAARVDLSVYDIAGRRIVRLVDRDQPMGMHEVSWEGMGSKGRCASGIYFCRLTAGKQRISRKMVLIK